MGKLNWIKKACGIFLLCTMAAIALPAQTTGDAPAGPIFTLLHSFDRTDGATPRAGLVQGTDGKFYGTTAAGGAGGGCYHAGCGTVFKITPSGTLTTLHSFDGIDGSSSFAGLVQGTDGKFYGTTASDGGNGAGTVFQITPTGTLTTLYNFDGTDDSGSFAGLVQGADGNFYGTTPSGGGNNGHCPLGCGTTFKISPSGSMMASRNFDTTVGASPEAALIQATDENFYGTTLEGGANNAGTVFKITPGGTLMMLYSFCSQSICADGYYPQGVLIQATDENFYGTTLEGGANNAGTVFKITPGGTLMMLYSFCSQSICADGYYPQGVLIQATDGKFYGTTSEGGASDDGTVFSLSGGIGPFVKILPPFGKVGTPVHILGTNLTGTTSVTFDGTPATFTVITKTLIFTNVPAGATTGTVQIETPKGTLSSNVPVIVN